MFCKNCDHILSSEDNFCNKCGGQVVEGRLTVRGLLVEFRETIFSWESNRPIKTFIDLLIKPEAVIDSYVSGVRKKYINPMGYVAIALTISGLFYFILNKFFPGALENIFITKQNNEISQEANRTILNFIMEFYSITFFAFIPVYAFMSWVIFFNKKKFNYAEHLILNSYAYAETAIITALLMIVSLWSNDLLSQISIFSIVFQFVYYVYVLKRVFNLTWLQLLIKTLYFISFLVAIFIGLMIIGIILAFLRG